MKSFSAQLGRQQCGQPDLDHCPLCSVAMKKPPNRQVCRDRGNPSVCYSPWSPGLYGTPRRLYGSGILEPSKTTRLPPSKINPTHFTAPSVRVFEAENPLTLGHLLCTKTTEVRAKEFKERKKQEKKIVSEEMAEKEEAEEEEEEKEEKEENKEREKEGEEKEEAEEKEKEEEKKEVEEDEDNEEEQERQEEGDKDKGKERWWPLQETDDQDHKIKWLSGSHVQGTAPRTVAGTAEILSTRQTYRPQEGNQPCQDSPYNMDVNGLEYPRKHSRGFSLSSSHRQDRDSSALGPYGEEALRCPQTDSAGCATLQETSLKKEVEPTGLPGFAPSQEPPKEKLGRKPQATIPRSPAILVPAPKNPCKRKGATLGLCLSPSRPPPPPALLQLLCYQQGLPPPPKIPRTDTQRESDTTKNRKHQAIQLSDDKVNVLQPKTQVVGAGAAPQPVLPRPPSASVSTVFGVPSLGCPTSTPLPCQPAGPPIPSVSSPSLTPSIPTIPISPSSLPSDSLPPSQARPCVKTLPDAKKKDPTYLTTSLAPGTSHLSRPSPCSFNPPSCRRESTVSMRIDSHPPLPFPAAPPCPFPRDPPTVFSTPASQACEDMCWEPSPWWPAEMDMDTTPPSEAATLSSPTLSHLAARTPSCAAKHFEFMDTTPPSKAVILHPSPVTNRASNSLPSWSMWRPTTACHHSKAQSTHTQLLHELQSNACGFPKKPSPATAAVGFPSQSASGSKAPSRFASSGSPGGCAGPSGMKQANERGPSASYIAKSTLGHALKPAMGTRQCSSLSTDISPLRPTSGRPVVPVSGENHSLGMAKQRRLSASSNPSTGGKREGMRGPAEPPLSIVCSSSKRSSAPVKTRARRL